MRTFLALLVVLTCCCGFVDKQPPIDKIISPPLETQYCIESQCYVNTFSGSDICTWNPDECADFDKAQSYWTNRGYKIGDGPNTYKIWLVSECNEFYMDVNVGGFGLKRFHYELTGKLFQIEIIYDTPQRCNEKEVYIIKYGREKSCC